MQDEVIKLPPAHVAVVETKPEDELVNEGDLTLVDLPEKEVREEVKILTLSPPEAIFTSIEYPPLHIFVSSYFSKPVCIAINLHHFYKI